MDPRYPIGKFEMPREVTPARRRQAIDEIAATPAKLRAAVKGLNDAQLDTPYREGGWTVRQVVHHVPDSHMNAFIRLRLRPHRGQAHDQALRRSRAGPNSPTRNAHRSIANSPRFFARPLGHPLAILKPEQFARLLIHPEHGEREHRLAALSLRVARQASHRAHHRTPQTKRLVV